MHRTNGISGTHQACAACKHQRKKCTDKCILAPFFPAEKIREFQAVHKVFGVSNVQKMVRSLLNDEDRKRVADSLVWEALCRQKDPVLGPYGEYRKMYDELKLYQTRAHHNPVVTPNGQNGVVYKSGTELVGWSTNGNGSNANNINKMNCGRAMNESVVIVDCIQANCDQVMDSGFYGNYGSQNNLHGAGKMINGFNQHYYLPGE